MVDKAHSLLTGGDLHDLKGVSSATDGQVPVAASGASVWGKLTATSLTGTGNPFGGQLLHLREEQPTNTAGQTPTTAGAWITRVLNTTKTNEISGASLTTNQISLPAGTYFIEAFCHNVLTAGSISIGFSSKVKLYNVTDVTDILLGDQQYTGLSVTGSGVSNTSSDITHKCFVKGRFTLAGTKTIDLRSQMSGNSTGRPVNYGTEVYADVLIWKVA